MPSNGIPGVDGWGLIVTDDEGPEGQPILSMTVKVYVPAVSPEKVADVPDPDIVVFPIDSTTSHVPVDGRPLRLTEPFGVMQSGCEIVTTTGGVGE